MTDEPFTGRNMDREPFTEEDNAKHRHMFEEVSEAWSTLKGVDEAAKGSRRLVIIFAGFTALGVVAKFLTEKGFFQ